MIIIKNVSVSLKSNPKTISNISLRTKDNSYYCREITIKK